MFTSDSLNHYFYGLTAHFGQWIRGVGRRVGQWQVAAGLLYGQVKKHDRRRRLVRVTHVLRCGTHTALKTALQTLGLSGRLNTAFVERVKKDAAAERGGPGSSHLVDRAGRAAAAAACGLVARLLSLYPAT